MDFLSILKEITVINEANKRTPDEARVKLQTLLDEVQKEQEGNGVLYLQQALQGYGLGELLGPPPALTQATYPEAPSVYEPFFNRELYQKILPLCQLADLYEKNGTPEEHAFKLATLFKDEKKIHDYLLKFKEGNSFKYLVHDACLFELPSPEACDFELWKHLANRTKNNQPGWMLNPRFREILPNAPAIDRIVRSGLEDAKQGKKTPNKEAIAAKIKELGAANQGHKTACKPQERTEAQKEEQKKLISKLTSEISVLRLELAELCAGLTLAECDIQMLRAFYEKYKTSSNPAHQLLVKHGISEKEIATFHSLTRCNDDEAIPNLVIDGAEIGYPGLYLKKIDTMSDQGAALAACLGKITRCCQYLGGAGSECAIHGITSPEGGFYVVCQGDAHHPSLDDEILAQAWTWRSKRGALCCDSIEVSRYDLDIEIRDLYRYFAHELCNNPDFKHFKVNRVNTGSGSGITGRVASKDFPATTEHLSDYQGYRDSESQLVLADEALPYLFYGQTASKAFQERIEQETEVSFKAMLEAEVPLISNEPLKKAVYLLLKSNQSGGLTLLSELAGARQKELEPLVDVNRHFMEELNKKIVDMEDLKRGAYVNAANEEGETALHLAADNPESLKVILGNYPEAERLDAMKRTSHYGDTLLLYAADNPESLKVILGDYPEAERLEAIKRTSHDGDTLLLAVAKNPESLKVILGVYPEKERLKAVTMTNHYDDTLLLHVAKNPESLKVIFELLPEAERLEAVKMANINGGTLLRRAAKYPESLKVFLGLYPEKELLEAVKASYSMAYCTVLHEVAKIPESLKIIFASLPEAGRLEAMKKTNIFGNTVLYDAAENPESLRVLFESLPEAERLEAVKMTDQYGLTVLHRAAHNPELLKVIVDDGKLSEKVIIETMKGEVDEDLIINQIIKNKLFKLQDELIGEDRRELETSIIELYTAKIRTHVTHLSSQEISLLDPGKRRDEIGNRIFEVLKQPSLTINTCQRLDSILCHAKKTASGKSPNFKFDVTGEFKKFLDEVLGERSETLGGWVMRTISQVSFSFNFFKQAPNSTEDSAEPAPDASNDRL